MGIEHLSVRVDVLDVDYPEEKARQQIPLTYENHIGPCVIEIVSDGLYNFEDFRSLRKRTLSTPLP